MGHEFNDRYVHLAELCRSQIRLDYTPSQRSQHCISACLYECSLWTYDKSGRRSTRSTRVVLNVQVNEEFGMHFSGSTDNWSNYLQSHNKYHKKYEHLFGV